MLADRFLSFSAMNLGLHHANVTIVLDERASVNHFVICM